MRLLNVIIEFLKIFIPVNTKQSRKKYYFKVKKFSSSKSQITEQKFIFKQIKQFDKKKILDYGCNDCSFSKFLGKKFTYWGVDNNQKIISEKLHRYSNKFKLVKNYKIPFKNNFFDCVLMSHVIGHIGDTKKLFKNLYKILSANGIVIVISPNKYYKFFYFFKNIFNQYQPDQTIIKHHSVQSISKILEKNNFKIIKYYKYSIKGSKIISGFLNSRILVIAKK